MTYDVHVKQIDSQPTAVVRRRVARSDLSKAVIDGCGTAWNALRAQHVAAGRNIAIYFDDAITVEAGVELQGPFVGHDAVIRSETPAGTVATTVHFGPYDQLDAAHSAIRQWSRDRGWTLAGPNWEIYGHWVEAWAKDPSQIRTDVFYLLDSDRTQNPT